MARTSRTALIVVVAVAIGVAAMLFIRSTPQMGTSAEVYRTVDALYSAVRERDEIQLANCERRLQEYREAGQLPSDAADHLDSIIHRARSGDWDSAAKKLYDFMLAQRREGMEQERPKPKK